MLQFYLSPLLSSLTISSLFFFSNCNFNYERERAFEIHVKRSRTVKSCFVFLRTHTHHRHGEPRGVRYNPLRRFFVVLSLQSTTVGNCTVTAGEQTSMHASLDTWHASLSCVTGKCSKRNPLQSIILSFLTGWAIKCLYRQLDFKIVKCTHIVCNFRSYTAIVRCYGHILR